MSLCHGGRDSFVGYQYLCRVTQNSTKKQQNDERYRRLLAQRAQDYELRPLIVERKSSSVCHCLGSCFSGMKAHIIYLIMEISQTKLFVQYISGIFSALSYFQLSNHISSGLSRVALVPRYLIVIELKASSNHITGFQINVRQLWVLSSKEFFKQYIMDEGKSHTNVLTESQFILLNSISFYFTLFF